MLLGKVKWYDSTKGYGFINPVGTIDLADGTVIDPKTDIFVHATKLPVKELDPGTTVEFEPKVTNRGIQVDKIIVK